MKLGAMDRELGALGPHDEGCSAEECQTGQSECGLHSAGAGVSQRRTVRSLGLRSRLVSGRLVGNRRNGRCSHRGLLHGRSRLGRGWRHLATAGNGASSTSAPPSKQEGEAVD